MGDPTLRRGLVSTRFGLVRHWTTGTGVPLILLHQSTQSSDEFLGLPEYLHAACRLIALDRPGHGASDTPDHELGVDEYCEAEHDAMSGDVDGLHRALPGSEMAEVKDCGPWLFYERPDACARVIRDYLDA